MIKQKEKIDYGLKFFVEVLGAEDLHWGFFSEKKFPNGEWSLSSFKEAQREYTRHLLSYIPDSVHKILDVGCGIGTTSNILNKKGYDVTSLSCDWYQGEVLKKKHPHLRFVKSKFEKFREEKQYDLLLLSESAQYLDMKVAPGKAYELLIPSGYMLVCDYFRKMHDPYYKTCKVLEEFKRGMEERGFVLLEEEDITDYVTPTIDFAQFYYNRYALPSIELLGEYVKSQISTPIRFFSNILLRKKLKKLNYYLKEHTPEKFDSGLFRKKLVYLIQLWKKKEKRG